ncbi:MAG: hypothetical protein J0H74_23455 [Chitinophagaceae bacterium]|nr:hypothetical protein [Chitinophagaceae bacterium]
MKNIFITTALLLVLGSCRKSSYTSVPDAAYLRVFNSLLYTVDVTNKDQPQPFLAMIIDPGYDKSGLITSGKILGDFLDKRAPYAQPYPANAGNTDYKNTEYPGSAKVPVGPILNGINLASWAQVPSGRHRIVFYTRPVSPTPFFSLDDRDRKSLLIDTTVDLTSGEIYTMEVLQKNMSTQLPLPVSLYIRQEQFARTAFDDKTLYVNFYNLSAEGYAAANGSPLTTQNYYNASNRTVGVGDTMLLYYNLYNNDLPYPYVDGNKGDINLIPGYNNVWLGSVIRSQTAGVAPYYGIPMFADVDTTGGVLSREWQLFILMAPGMTPLPGQVPTPGGLASASNLLAAIGCSNVANDGKYSTTPAGRRSVPRPDATTQLASCWLPNLIRYTASGMHRQQSFATISSIEIINGRMYMMSVQRTYPPPTF